MVVHQLLEVERYRHSKPRSSHLNRLFIPVIQVLEVDDVKERKVLPPNIHYALNQKVAEPTKVVYKWDQLGPWTQCSQLCQGETYSHD